MSLTNRQAVSIIGVMLCMAEEGEPGAPGPSPPFFRVEHVCKAIEGLAGKKDATAAQQVLQTQVSIYTCQEGECSPEGQGLLFLVPDTMNDTEDSLAGAGQHFYDL